MSWSMGRSRDPAAWPLPSVVSRAQVGAAQRPEGGQDTWEGSVLQSEDGERVVKGSSGQSSEGKTSRKSSRGDEGQ